MKKIKLFGAQARKYWISAAVVCTIALPTSLIAVSLTSGKRDFVLVNYQSYMSREVETELKNRYGVSFDSFETVEGAKKLLTSNSADIANTTTYEVVNWANEGVIQKLDWSMFKIQGITNAKEALSLFTPSVQAILTAYDLDRNGTINDEDNLLNYGVPYFLQDLVFAYRGEENPNLASPITWEKTLKEIVKDERFHSTTEPSVMSLDDPRTIYSIPRVIQSGSINPQTGSTTQDLIDTYKYLLDEINQLGNIPLKLNTDANAVLNSVADGTRVKGGFMFNGDAIYAAAGGDNGELDEEVGFHVVKPTDNSVALDLMVFNKTLTGETLNKAYALIKDLCLDFNDQDAEECLTYKNFDEVNYTSPLATLYDYILDNDYFEGNTTQIEAFKVTVDQNNVANKIEQPIDNLTKSNFSFAWINFKANLH